MNILFSASGIGLHSGVPCTVAVTFRPELPRSVFQTEQGDVEARPANICGDARLATDLRSGRARVQTVEHLLFALAGFSENAVIKVDGPEIPILDGSARPWLDLALAAGATPSVRALSIPSPLRVAFGDSVAELTPAQNGESPEYEVTLDFPGIPIGIARCVFHPFRDDFLQLASARTFALASQLDDILGAGCGRGGNLDNALVIGAAGALNPGGMRMSDEPARHKMLDAIGDLSLLGGLPFAHVSLHRPGHRLMHALVAAIERSGGTPAP